MKRKRCSKTLSPPVDIWLLTNLFLGLILITFSFLLIKERLFSKQIQVYLEKYKVYMDNLHNSTSELTNSHLQRPTNPSSSTEIIYLTKESFTLR